MHTKISSQFDTKVKNMPKTKYFTLSFLLTTEMIYINTAKFI